MAPRPRTSFVAAFLLLAVAVVTAVDNNAEPTEADCVAGFATYLDDFRADQPEQYTEKLCDPPMSLETMTEAFAEEDPKWWRSEQYGDGLCERDRPGYSLAAVIAKCHAYMLRSCDGAGAAPEVEEPVDLPDEPVPAYEPGEWRKLTPEQLVREAVQVQIGRSFPDLQGTMTHREAQRYQHDLFFGPPTREDPEGAYLGPSLKHSTSPRIKAGYGTKFLSYRFASASGELTHRLRNANTGDFTFFLGTVAGLASALKNGEPPQKVEASVDTDACDNNSELYSNAQNEEERAGVDTYCALLQEWANRKNQDRLVFAVYLTSTPDDRRSVYKKCNQNLCECTHSGKTKRADRIDYSILESTNEFQAKWRDENESVGVKVMGGTGMWGAGLGYSFPAIGQGSRWTSELVRFVDLNCLAGAVAQEFTKEDMDRVVATAQKMDYGNPDSGADEVLMAKLVMVVNHALSDLAACPNLVDTPLPAPLESVPLVPAFTAPPSAGFLQNAANYINFSPHVLGLYRPNEESVWYAYQILPKGCDHPPTLGPTGTVTAVEATDFNEMAAGLRGALLDRGNSPMELLEGQRLAVYQVTGGGRIDKQQARRHPLGITTELSGNTINGFAGVRYRFPPRLTEGEVVAAMSGMKPWAQPFMAHTTRWVDVGCLAERIGAAAVASEEAFVRALYDLVVGPRRGECPDVLAGRGVRLAQDTLIMGKVVRESDPECSVAEVRAAVGGASD